MLLKEEAHNFLRAYDTDCRHTEDDRAAGVQCKLYKFHCSAGIMVPGGEDSEPYMVGTALDSGAGISCVSEATVCALQKRFPVVDVVQPYDGEQHQVVLADGRVVPIEWQMCSLTATIMTPWAPVTIRLALAVMPGKGDLLILGSKMLREKLSTDVMKQLRDTAAASGGGASSTEHAPAEVPAMLPEIFGVRRVVVIMEAMQKVADIEVEAAGETDGFKDALLDRVLKMMMGFGDSEMEQREQVFEDAVLRMAQAGMPPAEYNGASASGAGPLQGDVPPGVDRRAAGAGGVDAGNMNAHCTDYEGEAEIVRSEETCVVVGADENAGACARGVS